MKKLLITAAISLAISAPAFAEDGMNARITKLEQELELLKRQQEVKEEVDKSAADKYAKVEVNEKGASLTSPDGNFQLKLRAYAQGDNRTFIDNDNKGTAGTNNTSQFLIRSARPIIEWNYYKDFSGRIMLDFGGGQTRLLDAYTDYKPDPLFNIRLGKFKAPIGLERVQSEQELQFVERGLSTNLVPFRDIGLEIYGEIIPQTLEYQLALTNGAVDLADTSGDSDNSKDITGRIFARPFRSSDIVPLQGLGVGIAASYGNRSGSTGSTQLPAYKTISQSNFFTYAGTTFADGTISRINPELYYAYGPFGILADYVYESQDVRNGTKRAKLGNEAYSAAASYVLTGEDASFDGVKPTENFNPNAGTWGAFEILGRYGQFHADNNSFKNGFASDATSAGTAKESTIGFNWYLNPSLKFNFDFARTSFEHGAPAGADLPDEKVFLSRAQYRF